MQVIARKDGSIMLEPETEFEKHFLSEFFNDRQGTIPYYKKMCFDMSEGIEGIVIQNK